MTITTIRLLQTAADNVQGPEALAERLGVRPAILSLYLADVRPLPDALLLKAVDIILEDRESRFPRPQHLEARRDEA